MQGVKERAILLLNLLARAKPPPHDPVKPLLLPYEHPYLSGY